MSILHVNTLGILSVDYDSGSPLPNESYILQSPDGARWTLLVNGTTGAVTLTSGATGDAVHLSLFDSAGNEWLLTVDDTGLLFVDSSPGPIVFSPIGNEQFKTESGALAIDYLLFIYAAGAGFTPITTYTTKSFSSPQTNPIILNANGFPTDPIFIELGKFYKFILALPGSLDPPLTPIYTWDGVNGGALVNRTSPTEFSAQAVVMNFVSESMFTVANDQRTTFALGRRMKFPGSPTLYGTVVGTPVFDGTVTTITMAMDSGVLLASMTQVYPAMLQSTHSGMPSRVTIGTRTKVSGALSMPVASLFNLLPAGIIVPYAKSDQPAGWLRCDGASYLRATYAILFSAIGTAFGMVDGTHFNVPDLRGRMPLGLDTLGGAAAASRVTAASVGGANAGTIGGVGGAETQTILLTQMPIHDHQKTLSSGSLANSDEAGATGTTSVSRSDFATRNAGSDTPHNNMPPFETTNYLIFSNA